jgi:hypothetical protein
MPDANSNDQFPKENIGSMCSPAPRTERIAQFVDFSVVFDVRSFKKAGNLRKN